MLSASVALATFQAPKCLGWEGSLQHGKPCGKDSAPRHAPGAARMLRGALPLSYRQVKSSHIEAHLFKRELLLRKGCQSALSAWGHPSVNAYCFISC